MKNIANGIKVGLGWAFLICGTVFFMIMPHAFGSMGNIPMAIVVSTATLMITGAILVK